MALSHTDNLQHLITDPPQRLKNHHRERLYDFLVDDIAANLFVISWLETNGVEPSQPGRFQFYGWFDNRRRFAAVALNVSDRLLMLDTRHRDFACSFGNFFHHRRVRFQHIVSPRRSVAPFWSVYSRRDPEFPVDARLIQHQRLYELLPSQLNASPERCSGVRRGRPEEIDAIFLASVRMHREETREDPLERNASTFRRHVNHRVDKGRTFVWFDDNHRLIFKADISTRCSRGAQISGVYTDPNCRNQGIATRAMADICHIFFDEGLPRLTLYVNRSNTPARRVYERLGFQYQLPYQTVFVND